MSLTVTSKHWPSQFRGNKHVKQALPPASLALNMAVPKVALSSCKMAAIRSGFSGQKIRYFEANEKVRQGL